MTSLLSSVVRAWTTTTTTTTTSGFLLQRQRHCSKYRSRQIRLFGKLGEESSSHLNSINANNLPRLYVDTLPLMPTRASLGELTKIRQRQPSMLSEERIISLSPDQSHYLSSVLRLTKSHRSKTPFVRLFDSSGEEWLAELLVGQADGGDKKRRRRDSSTSVIPAVCRSRLRSLQQQNGNLCWLCVAPPKKKDRLRWMVEKTTEMGVSGFCWIDTAFSETTAGDRTVAPFNKLLAYAVEASEQCERLDIPEFVTLDGDQQTGATSGIDDGRQRDSSTLSLQGLKTAPKSCERIERTKISDFFHAWSNTEKEDSRVKILVCRERANVLPVWQALDQIYSSSGGSKNTAIAFFIGPEGGWSPEENNMMDTLERDYPGHLLNISLGSTILRSETACLVAMASFTLYHDAKKNQRT